MAPKIDPAKVHLGDTQHQFYAEYLPSYSTSSQKPLECELPPLSTLTLTPVTLVPIEEVCVFTFPDIIPIPPVYNPPFVPGGCGDFNVINTFTVTSPLSGALTAEAQGPPDCGITIGGSIGLADICEEITTQVDILSGGKNPPKLSLTFENSGPPNCNLTLAGSIDVDSCETFETSGSIAYGTVKTGTTLNTSTYTATGAPKCKLTLGGEVKIKACDTISITPETAPSSVVTFKSGANTTTLNLGGTLTVSNGADDCSKKIKLQLTPETATVTISPSVNTTQVSGLYIQSVDDTLSLAGTLTTSCTASPGPTELVLDTLSVNYIYPPSEPCCANPYPYLDLCDSKLYLQKYRRYMSLATDDLREDDVARFRPVTATVNGVEDIIYVLATGGVGSGNAAVTIKAAGGGETVPCHFRVTDATDTPGVCRVKVEYGTISTTQGHRAPLGMALGTDYILEISQSCHIYVAMLFDTATMTLNPYETAISLLQAATTMANTTSMQYVRVASVVVDPGSETIPAKITEINNRCFEVYPDACNLDWSTV